MFSHFEFVMSGSVGGKKLFCFYFGYLVRVSGSLT